MPLESFGAIDYEAQVGDLFENEHVHCFYGQHKQANDVNNFNPVEVQAVEWLTIAEIRRRINRSPQLFSEWFKIYMAEHRNMIDALVA